MSVRPSSTQQLNTKVIEKTTFYEKYETPIRIIKVILLRICVVGLCSFFISFPICMSGRYNFLGLIVPVVGIVLEAFYICIFRKGREFKW